ncbi:hypothetical protein D3C87_1369610 [compost metagenome]
MRLRWMRDCSDMARATTCAFGISIENMPTPFPLPIAMCMPIDSASADLPMPGLAPITISSPSRGPPSRRESMSSSPVGVKSSTAVPSAWALIRSSS